MNKTNNIEIDSNSSIQKQSGERKLRIKFLLVVAVTTISTTVSAFIGEGIVRSIFIIPTPIANYYPLTQAKAGGTIHVKQYEFEIEYKFNSLGFRDKEISIKKDTGVKRVLFVGDSVSEGFGVPVNERFSDKVISKLGKNYEGINISQLATNPDTYFDNLITFGVSLKPDVVVMGVFMGNDFMGGSNYKIPENYSVNTELSRNIVNKNSPTEDFIRLRYLRTLISDSRSKAKVLQKRSVKGNFWDIYFGTKMSKDFYVTASKLDESEYDNLTKDFNQELMKQYFNGMVIPTLLLEGVKDKLSDQQENQFLYTDEDYEKTWWFINETNKMLSKQNIKFIVVVIPDINQVHHDVFKSTLEKDFKFSELPSRLSQLEGLRLRLVEDLSEARVNFIDVTGDLSASKSITYYVYDQHLNEVGHEIVTERLEGLIKNSLSKLKF